MAISTEEAFKMVEESMAGDASQVSKSTETDTTPAQTSVADENKDGDVNAKPEESEEGEPKQTNGEEHDGKSSGTEKEPPIGKKERRTHNDKRDYAFKKLKEEKDRVIASKDRRIAELEAKLKLTTKLEEQDFNGDSKKFREHELDLALDQRELERLKGEREEAANDAIATGYLADIQEKAGKFFEGEEGEHFDRLLDNGFNAFVQCVNAHDANGVIGDFLDDSDNSPLVLRCLMTQPAILKRILDKKTDMGKLRELQVLENNIVIRRNIASKAAKSAGASGDGAAKKTLPKLGSLTKTETKAESQVFDDAWANQYLNEHKSGRF